MSAVRQVKRNVLDVTHQVSQYQNIIAELKDEIGRLKTKITVQVIFTIFTTCAQLSRKMRTVLM